jgi:uncharacterized protein YdhG (YjbR/CyaY superfamily)
MPWSSLVSPIDEYIAAQPAASQPRLRELRAIVRDVMPDAAESISYGMPTFKSGATRIYFAAAKKHIGLYATATYLFPDELKAYATPKGTVRFPLDQPIPDDLVRRLIAATIAEREAAARKR